MSTSDLYRVYRTKTTHLAEFRNGWGTAPLLWEYLSERFIGAEYRWCFDAGKDRRLWDLATDERVPRSLRLAHAFTFDRGICPLTRVGELADACDEVGATCAKEQHVNHWAAVAKVLREARAKPRQLGWALSCTSVNDVWMEWKGEPKPWDIFSVLQPAVSV